MELPFRRGKWTVLAIVESESFKRPRYLCRCDCGTEATVRQEAINNLKSTMCLRCSRLLSRQWIKAHMASKAIKKEMSQ